MMSSLISGHEASTSVLTGDVLRGRGRSVGAGGVGDCGPVGCRVGAGVGLRVGAGVGLGGKVGVRTGAFVGAATAGKDTGDGVRSVGWGVAAGRREGRGVGRSEGEETGRATGLGSCGAVVDSVVGDRVGLSVEPAVGALVAGAGVDCIASGDSVGEPLLGTIGAIVGGVDGASTAGSTGKVGGPCPVVSG